jgi:hypothetical protein
VVNPLSGRLRWQLKSVELRLQHGRPSLREMMDVIVARSS